LYDLRWKRVLKEKLWAAREFFSNISSALSNLKCSTRRSGATIYYLCESQKEIMMACHYGVFIIPQEKCMKFLPKEIIKNKEKLCICYLMFDNFIDKVQNCIHPLDMWCDQVLWHPLQISNLSSYQRKWYINQVVFL